MTLYDLVDEFRDEVRASDVTWWDNHVGCSIFIPRINDREYYAVLDFAEDLKRIGHKVKLIRNVDDYDELDSIEMDVYPL